MTPAVTAKPPLRTHTHGINSSTRNNNIRRGLGVPTLSELSTIVVGSSDSVGGRQKSVT